MGRVKKYDDPEAAKVAQKEQIRKSNQKYQAKRKKFRADASKDQLTLVKLLNDFVIKDTEWITATLGELSTRLPKEEKKEEEEEKKFANEINDEIG
jgi:hypothetical protein